MMLNMLLTHGRLLIWITNSSGPKLDPWGAPFLMSKVSEPNLS